MKELTLNVFFLTEAFLRVAVAGSVARLDSVPEASFMTADHSLPFNDNEQPQKKMTWVSIFTGALCSSSNNYNGLTCAVLWAY